MSEEKCDHLIGRDYNDDVYESCLLRMGKEDKSNYWRGKGWKRKFKFCPLCGVEIEGD